MKKIALFLISLFIMACTSNISPYSSIKSTGNKYQIDYLIYWGVNYRAERNIIYTNDSVYVCSFQGTNFLLEKNNAEELFSTTAPIRILSIEKIKYDN